MSNAPNMRAVVALLRDCLTLLSNANDEMLIQAGEHHFDPDAGQEYQLRVEYALRGAAVGGTLRVAVAAVEASIETAERKV